MRHTIKTILSLTSVFILILVSATAQASFLGQDIRASVYFPEIGTFVGEPEIATVTSDEEFTFFPTKNPLLNADFSSTTIDIEFVIYGGIETASFTGVVFDDVSNNIQSITGVSLESSTNPEIDISRVTFDENSIAINFQGIENVTGDSLSLNVTFVPLPSALILFISGFVMLSSLTRKLTLTIFSYGLKIRSQE